LYGRVDVRNKYIRHGAALLVFVLYASLLASSAQAASRFDGWVEYGGQRITVGNVRSTVNPPTSPYVQGSYPGAVVTVYLPGTLTPATLYTDSTLSTIKANPFSASTTGYYWFYAKDGCYDLRFSGGGLPSVFTRPSICASSTNPSVRVFNVMDYGAVADGTNIGDATMTAGSNILTTPVSNRFISTDVGKTVIIEGVGAAGAPVRSTIVAYISPNQVQVGFAAITTTIYDPVAIPPVTFTAMWGTDNSAAILAAINAANTCCGVASGGTVYFPHGFYHFDSPFPLQFKKRISILGETPTGGFQTILRYQGPNYDADPRLNIAYDVRGSNFITLEKLLIMSDVTGYFTGTLISASGDAPILSATTNLTINKCSVGSSREVAAVLLDFTSAESHVIRDSSFGGGTVQIWGVRSAVDPWFGYSNHVLIENTAFQDYVTSAIRDPGEAWKLESCLFEPSRSGGLNIVNMTKDVKGFRMTGSWIGDQTEPNTLMWVRGAAIEISGNYVGAHTLHANNYFIRASGQIHGMVVEGNVVSPTIPNPVHLGNYVNSGTIIRGNVFGEGGITGTNWSYYYDWTNNSYTATQKEPVGSGVWKYSVRARLGANQLLASGAYRKIEFDEEMWDDAGISSQWHTGGAKGDFFIPIAGLYSAKFQCRLDYSVDGSGRFGGIYLDGARHSLVSMPFSYVPSAGAAPQPLLSIINASVMFKATAGQVVTFQVFHDVAAGLNAWAGIDGCWASIIREN
jgi:hypothetical protein